MILYHLPPLTQRKPYLPPSISEHKNNGNMLFGTSPFAFIRDSLIPFLLEVRWNKYQSLLSLGVTGSVPVSLSSACELHYFVFTSVSLAKHHLQYTRR